jgi:hypothetical protein
MSITKILTFFFCLGILSDLSGQGKVFMIGQNQKQYDKLLSEYPIQMLQAFDNNLDSASVAWNEFQYDLEKYAENQGVEFKGLKLWINLFIDKEKINGIYFYPKPNSRNTDYENVKLIIERFIGVYKFKASKKVKFAHFSSASFPVFGVRVNSSQPK